jgi:hypothetical protein
MGWIGVGEQKRAGLAVCQAGFERRVVMREEEDWRKSEKAWGWLADRAAEEERPCSPRWPQGRLAEEQGAYARSMEAASMTASRMLSRGERVEDGQDRSSCPRYQALHQAEMCRASPHQAESFSLGEAAAVATVLRLHSGQMASAMTAVEGAAVVLGTAVRRMLLEVQMAPGTVPSMADCRAPPACSHSSGERSTMIRILGQVVVASHEGLIQDSRGDAGRPQDREQKGEGVPCNRGSWDSGMQAGAPGWKDIQVARSQVRYEVHDDTWSARDAGLVHLAAIPRGPCRIQSTCGSDLDTGLGHLEHRNHRRP